MRVRTLIGGAIVASGVVAAASLPAWSAGAQVTRGDFHAFAVGTGEAISGHAEMVRTADGHTIVSIHVEGLEPGVTYAAHVHAAACAVDEADGHYKFDASGPAAPPNEIWPGPITANGGGVANGRTEVDAVAGETAMSVVVHRPGAVPNKIACADLH